MIDSHAHLQSEAFAEDLPEVLDRAIAAGITEVLVPGWDVASSRAAVDLVRASAPPIRPRLLAAAGIHPHGAHDATPATWAEIEELTADEVVVAVGETGLDYDRMFSPRETQLENLRRHLDLARRHAKPLVLHCRSAEGRADAQDELIAELESAGVGGPAWREAFADRPIGVLHSFSGSLDYAERALALGLSISFSGLVFRRGQETSAAVARLTPSDRFLVETDAPFLPARGAPRRRNEPAFLTLTAEWVASQRGTNADTVGALVSANMARVFHAGSDAVTSIGSA